ncbi:MAG: NADH pyrophosphatase zinc ribbon domain-containing protein [Anaerolineaceae bacterium]|nr:NADH pyrophosphatase zinc ribbon domain-containing protein [Anaerolineaceae bacterium]
MNNDFITLTCPSCGGKLEISSNTTSLKCPNCGNEHIVRRDAGTVVLEWYARCPKCNRNDKVEKVTAIVAKEYRDLSGVTIEKSNYRDRDGNWHSSNTEVPFYGIQSTNLGQKLSPPQKPGAAQGPGYWWALRFLLLFYILVGFIFGGGAIGALINGEAESWGAQLLYYIAAGVGAVILIFLFVFLQKKYSEKIKLAELETERREREETPRWNNAMQRWEKLYYCYRDGCVFIPGENDYADLENLKRFIFSK